MVAQVLVEIKAKKMDQTFTYHIPASLQNDMKIGIRVVVPFGKQKLEGFVLTIEQEPSNCEYQIKDIMKIIDEEPVINEEMLEMGNYIKKKTFCNLISAYQTMLPRALKAKEGFIVPKKYVTYIDWNIENRENICKTEKQKLLASALENGPILKKEGNAISTYIVKTFLEKGILKEYQQEIYRLQNTIEIYDKKPVLTQEQEQVIEKVKPFFHQFQPFLLHGVTGSGKTEVYMSLIENVLKEDKEIIVLVPEISLTPQLVDTFKHRFGNEVAILHSGLSQGEKYDEWRKIQKQEVKIVIGARSAIFAPFTKLGLIIIDEEHSDTYKQENTPRYHAIDLALWRGKRYHIPVILGSATPSIESYTRAKIGVYQLLEMPHRVNRQLPKVTLVDMKEEMKKGNRIFSDILKEKIHTCLNKQEQVIILLNRRGYSTVITCHNCGWTQKCPNCDIPLTYHKTSHTMRCHYCGYGTSKVMVCPDCKSKDINEFGMGTEKLEQALYDSFPSARIVRMDVDTTANKGSHSKIIEEFQNHQYDLLLGTQMIAKGLDFPNVTLVGVLNGDASLNIPDFRSGERTFTLLNQVAGRAGRSEKSGEVIIQGFNIDHYSIQTAAIHDYHMFYQQEMKIRKTLQYPPFYNLLLIRIKSVDYDTVMVESKKIGAYLKKQLPNHIILGPNMATMPRVNNIYHMQIMIKYKKIEDICPSLQFIIEHYRNHKVQVEIEQNPLRI